ncbi:MAG: hypothetical protein HY248_04170, partial [Fimbriimonas ginsengisoli]|nr:hypothetical protein [Fimbriimonas ginsengisoli]
MSDTASLETPQHRPEGAHNPWAFVPALYFMQALPVTLVQEVAAIVYKDLGVENVSITRWTSLIALPWTIKLLLGPMVDLNFTKRGWTLTMQALLTGIMALVAFAVGLPNAFEITLGLLLVTAIFSAMCDIATDGFYLLALPKDRQAAFVGVQSTCYRLGRLFAVGMLVYLAGRLRVDGVGISASWTLVLACGTLAYALGRILVGYTLPRPEEDRPRDLPSGENRRNLVRTALVVALAFLAYFALSAVVRMAAHGLWYGFDGSAEGRLKGWMLGPDAFRNEAIQLLICSGLAVGCLVQVRQRLIGSEMGHAFSTYFRQPGIMA